ncbi:MAG: hypothetical protein H0X31_23995 [Nostocaceae cyanobacterium]|nr:hypothetical protein [Nostocaceae cyanobacterium]
MINALELYSTKSQFVIQGCLAPNRFSEGEITWSDRLSVKEIEELDAIGELDRVFTQINVMMAAQGVSQ